MGTPTVRICPVELERQDGVGVGELEGWRQHPEDPMAHGIEPEGLADQGRIAAQALPEPVSEHHDVRRAGGVVLGPIGGSPVGHNPQHREDRRARKEPPDPLGLAASLPRQVDRIQSPRRHAGPGLSHSLEIGHFGLRERAERHSPRSIAGTQGNELAGLRKRKRLEDGAPQQREHGGRGSYGERERGHDRKRKGPLPVEHSKRPAGIPQGFSQHEQAPSFPHLFAVLLGAAELDQRAAAGLGRRHPQPNVVLGLSVDMELELGVHPPLRRAAPHQ